MNFNQIWKVLSLQADAKNKNLVTLRWLLDDCLMRVMTTWQSPKDSLTNAWKLPWQFADNCLMTAWWLPNDYLTVAWQLFDDFLTFADNFLMTPWWLPDDCLITTWQLPEDSWQLFDDCLITTWQLPEDSLKTV